MPCPQVRTAPLYPSSGKRGVISSGASSAQKRLIQREDCDEILPKRARPTHEYSSLYSKCASESSLGLAKIERSPLELQYREQQLYESSPKVSPPRSKPSPELKYEENCSATNIALIPTSSHVTSPGHIQSMKWAPDEHCYKSTTSPIYDLRPFSTPPHTHSVPSTRSLQTESSLCQDHQKEVNISDHLWPTGLNGPYQHEWPPVITQVGGWLDVTPADQLAAFGGSVPYAYLEQEATLSESSPATHLHSTCVQSPDTNYPYSQHELWKTYSPQLIQGPGFVDSTLPQPSDFDSVPHELRAYLDSLRVCYEHLDETSPSLSWPPWPSQKHPHNTLTGDQYSTFMPQDPPGSDQWSTSPLSIAGRLPYGIQEGRSVPVAATIKSESHAEAGIDLHPTTAEPSCSSASADFQVAFNYKQGPSNGHGPLLPLHQSPRSEPNWPFHPDHDPDLLFACQSSRQVSQEVATETSNGNLKPRKPFSEDKREETNRTRDVGACVRCKMQRVRCRPNLADPDGPCIPCLKVANNPSKKVIHHIGCHRYKLQEITIFRTSPTPVNPKRWHTAQVRDVLTYGKPIFVKLKQRFGQSFSIKVSTFTPLEDDETTRAGRDPNTGEEYNEPLGLFALWRAHEVIDDYRKYIHENWYRDFTTKCARPGNMQCAAEGLVADIYKWALRHLDCLPFSPSCDFYHSSATSDPRTVSERNFMQGTLMMCFVLRQALGQSWIDPEGLNPEQWPRHEKFTPLRGLVGTPRMIVSQLDCIRISCVLRPLTRPLLKVLTTWIAERRYDCWLSIFYATFIFLREIALATHDAYAHGQRKKTYDPKDPKPNHHSIIAEMHESANVVLAHWHYFNCSTNLETLDETARGKSPLRKLTLDQFQTMKGLWTRMRLWKAGRPQCANLSESRRLLFLNEMGFNWCHPLYFAAQMFEPSWSPLEVFTS